MNSDNRRFGISSSLAPRLMIGTALSALAIGGAQAQGPVAASETVVVTGTSIKGAQPVGSNLITVDRASIESTGAQNVQQLLSDVPQLNTFGGTGQGGSNSDFAGGFAPAIHGIGGGSSSATLVLIDGHRFPTQGLTEAQADPTVIPASALERVEVLPDGASSIYGSDAVSGVVNFITRKNFTGFEVGTQAGVADSYNTFTANATFGKSWTGGSVLVTYDYSNQSHLMFGTRDFMTARQDIRRGVADPSQFVGFTTPEPASYMTATPATGPGTTVAGGLAIPYPSAGVNYQTFNCPVATIAANSSANAYYYQPTGGYGGTSYSVSTTNAPSQGACDNFNYSSVLPSTIRHGGMIQVRQEITDNIIFDMEAVYGSRYTFAPASRGTVNAYVFGPTATAANTGNAAFTPSQINPFYVGNAATGTNVEYIRYDFDALLGTGAGTKQMATNAFVASGLTWDLGDNREVVLSSTFGDNFNSQHAYGTVGAAEVNLGLNGTPSACSGTTTLSCPTNVEQDVYAANSVYNVTRALTALNAIDVWNPAGSTNRTSASIINALKTSNNTFTNANQGLEDVSLKFDGPLFDLPAGSVKIAAGAEYTHSTMDEYGTTLNASGPSLSNSNGYYLREGRTVWAAFLEADIPLINGDMKVPLVQSFQVDISGRYDKYSDVGDTSNPKVAFDWVITDGLKARGSYGTSFVAPTIHDAQNINSQSGVNALTAQPSAPFNTIMFNTTLPYNGGAGIAGTWVSTGPSCATGGGTPVNAAGATVAGTDPTAAGCKVTFAAATGGGNSAAITVAGGNGSLKPAIGRSWEGGFDIDFGRLVGFEGLTAGATFWDINYRGLITNQNTQTNIPSLTSFAPIGGWTPTSAAIQAFTASRPINIALPATIWATYDGRLQNAFNIWENGVDFSINYKLRTDDLGTFSLGWAGTELLRYTTQGGNTGPLLNTLDGKNSPRYNSAELMFRGSLGWAYDAFSSLLSMNYIHPQNFTSASFPYNFPGAGRSAPLYVNGGIVVTSAGIVHVGSTITFDLSTNYELPQGFFGLPAALSDGMSVSLIVQNILDTDPPFAPSATNGQYGYFSGNGYPGANPIGRLITLGLKKKF